MPLNRYTVKYWSAVDWGWTEYDALAESEDQIRTKVEAECKQEFRIKHCGFSETSSLYTPPADSLEIVCHGEVTLPYILN